MRAKTTKRGLGWALRMFESLGHEARECWAAPDEKAIALLVGHTACPAIAKCAIKQGLTPTKAYPRFVLLMPPSECFAFFAEYAPRTLPVARGYLAKGCSVAVVVNAAGSCELLFSKNRRAVLGAIFTLDGAGGEA